MYFHSSQNLAHPNAQVRSITFFVFSNSVLSEIFFVVLDIIHRCRLSLRPPGDDPASRMETPGQLRQLGTLSRDSDYLVNILVKNRQDN